MSRVYGYVRPYPGRLGRQVRDFVEEQGFSLGPGMVVAAGATDTYASRWILRATMDLLVLPFHLHRGDGGQVLDAIGVLMELPEDVNLGGLTVFMPVRAFSWGASFQRRIEALRETRPNIASQLLVAHQDEVGSAPLASRLRRAHARPASTAPLVTLVSMLPGSTGPPSSSISPPTVRDIPSAAWRVPAGITEEDLDSSSWPLGAPFEADSVSPPATRSPPVHISSSRPPPVAPSSRSRLSVPPDVRSPSSRPSETRPTRPPIDVDASKNSSKPALSGERLRGEYRISEAPSLPSSLILPRVTSEDRAESATERFRRAAEIGARARRRAAGRKKDS